MRIILTLILSSIVALTAFAQNTYQGSFNQIKLFGKVKCELIKADVEKVEVISEEDMSDKLTVGFEQKLLKIQSTKLLKDEYVVVKIYYKNFSQLSMEAGAQAYSKKRLSIDNFNLKMGSGSDFDADLETDNFTLKVGQGAIATLSGTADNINFSANTGGVIEAENFVADACIVKTSTGGVVSIKYCENLNAAANTGGEIEYLEKPKNITQKTGTGGSISLDK